MAGSGQGAGRRTNFALLALLALSLLTGTLSYALGTTPATLLATTAHGAVGLALVLLVPWKQATARRGLRRPTHRGRTAGLALAVLLLLTVVAGVAQAALGWGRCWGSRRCKCTSLRRFSPCRC